MRERRQSVGVVRPCDSDRVSEKRLKCALSGPNAAGGTAIGERGGRDSPCTNH